MGTITSLAEYKESADRAALRRRMWRCSERIKEYEAKGDEKSVHRNLVRYNGYLRQMNYLMHEDPPYAG